MRISEVSLYYDYRTCSNFSSEQLSGIKHHLEWNCKVSERWQIIAMGGRIFRIDDGKLEPSKNGSFGLRIVVPVRGYHVYREF